MLSVSSLKWRYYFQYWFRTIIVSFVILAIGWLLWNVLNFQINSKIIIIICMIIWLVLVKSLFTKFILPKIWKYKVIIDEEQFSSLGGKTYVPPPEKFKDNFKYNGERDFDFYISQYNGFRIIKWVEMPPYTVYFLKKSDAVLFRLVL